MRFWTISSIALLLPGIFAFVPNQSKVTTPVKESSIRRFAKDADKEELKTGAELGIFAPNFPVQLTPDEKEVEKLLKNYGEESRKYRRSYFTAADWVRSRRPDRFVGNLSTIYKSGLIRQLGFELPFITMASVFIVLWNDFLIEGFTDFSGVHHDKLIDIPLPALELPIAPFSLSVAALGLLLTFRTNVSYARWNEARTAWGKVINDSRSIVRMGAVWATEYNKNIENDTLQRLGEAVCSFSRTLQNRVLSPQEDEDDYRLYLATRITDEAYAERLLNAKHRPTTALSEISSCIVDLDLNPIHQVEIEKTVTGLCDALGASERIFTSPVPTFYTRHTARFLAVWMIFLPMALYDPFKMSWNHWGMIPATAIIGGFLLGIEELATQMEEPFSILPMEKMCEGSIRTPVMEQVERSKAYPWQGQKSRFPF